MHLTNSLKDANRDIDSDFHDFKDRHERVRAALFVYICILNSRRRTGVSLWDIFGSKKIVKQIKLEFHNCLENVDNLLSGFESWQQHILKKFQRFDTLRDNLEFLDSDENPLNTMLDDFEEDEKLFDDDEIRLAMKIARD